MTRRSHAGAAFLIALLIPLAQPAAALASPSATGHPAESERVRGAGVSHPANDDRRSLQVDAQSRTEAPGEATGHVTFDHHSPAGLNHFTGTVSCLSVSGQAGATTVTLSGRIEEGHTAAGAPLAGKAYTFTLKSNSANSQSFSPPTFEARQAPVAPCAGSNKKQVPVTQGGFEIGAS
jgi:hypothetical protein